jgi:hypothetical protein
LLEQLYVYKKKHLNSNNVFFFARLLVAHLNNNNVFLARLLVAHLNDNNVFFARLLVVHLNNNNGVFFARLLVARTIACINITTKCKIYLDGSIFFFTLCNFQLSNI